MEKYAVKKLNKKNNINASVPGSKSITNRALMLAAMSDGICTLNGVLFSSDSRAFLDCLISLGFSVQIDEESAKVVIKGENGRIPNRKATINVQSAGTAARFMTVFLAVAGGDYTLQSSEQMKKRPMSELLGSLTAKGVEIKCLEEEGHFPFEIHSKGIKSGNIKIDTTTSSQYASALLMASVMNGMNVELTGSRVDGAYIKITTNMLKQFDIDFDREGNTYIIKKQSYICNVYNVEPDMSAACYFYAMAALLGISVTVPGIHENSLQGDVEFIHVLEKMGCTCEDTPKGICVTGPKDGKLKGVTVNMHSFSDQAITLAAIAPFADAPTTITGIAHIRLQESNRIAAICTELARMGIRCEEGKDSITIWPGSPKPALIQTYDDHRMAMGFSLVGLRAEKIVIHDPMCCKKTFEKYFEVLDEVIEKMQM